MLLLYYRIKFLLLRNRRNTLKTEAKAKKGGLIKRFMPYYKRHLGTLSFDLFCAALTTLCELALPIIVREITGTATNNPEALTLKFILTLGAIYIALKIIDAVAYYYMASILYLHIEIRN